MKLLYLTSALASADIIDVIANNHGSEFASNLSNHGCHCKKFAINFDKDNVGGSPVDSLDALCRDFFSAKGCMKAIGGKCQDGDSSQYENNFSDACSSYAEGSCGSEICKNNDDFVNNVGNFVGNAFDSNAQCTSLDSAPKSHCCGDYPSLLKFSEDEGTCVNGQFQAGAPVAATSAPLILSDPTFLAFENMDPVDGHAQWGIQFEDDYIYLAGKENKKPIVWAFSTTTYQVVKKYQYGSIRWFHDLFVTDKFVVASLYDSISDGGGIVVFDKETTDFVSYTPHESPQGIALDGDNIIVASYYAPQAFYKIDLETGAVTQQATIEGSTSIVKGRSASFDENLFYIGAEYNGANRILGYDKNTLTIQKVMSGHTSWVTSMVTLTHPTLGDLVISTSFDQTIKIWNPHTETMIKSWSINAGVLLLKNGYLFATVGGIQVQIFDINNILENDDTTPMFVANNDITPGTDMRYCYVTGFNAELKQMATGCNMDGLFVYQL